jgi:hypothetical protein
MPQTKFPRRARFQWLAGAPPEIIDVFRDWDDLTGTMFFFMDKANSTPNFVTAVMVRHDGRYSGNLHVPLEVFAAKRVAQRNRRVSWPAISTQIAAVVRLALENYYTSSEG